MPHFSPEAKDAILREYREHDSDHSFAALARRHPPATAREIAQWDKRWDRTPESLERRAGSGRHSLIEPAVRDYVISTALNEAHQQHRAIHYPEVADALEDATGVRAAPSTVRTWGEQLEARQMTTIPRSTDQRTCTIQTFSDSAHRVVDLLIIHCVLSRVVNM